MPDAVTTEADPLSLFRTWLEEAEQSEPNDPNGHDARDRNAGRQAIGAHGAAQGRR